VTLSAATPTDTLLPLAVRTWRWRVFVSTWLCYAGFYFCRKPFSIAKSRIGLDLHLDTERLAWIGAAYLIAYTLGQFLSGAIGPRFGPRRMLLWGMAISIASGLGFAVSSTLDAFIALSVINGFAQAVGWSNTVGTMAAWFSRSERGTIMGVWSTCFQVGNVAAPAATAWVLQHFGFRWAFVAGSAVLALVWVIVWFFQANRPEDKGLPPIAEPEPQHADGTTARIAWDTNTWITVLLVGGAYFGMKFIRYALDSWAPFFLSRKFGLPDDQAGYVSTVFGVCGIAGVVFAGWVSDRYFASRRARISFFMVVGVVLATIGMVTVGTGTAMAFAISMGLVGFTLYGPDALMTGAGAMDIGKAGGAVRAAGIISGLGSAGSVLQELLIGRLYTNGGGAIAPVLATLLGSALLTAACLGTILWRNRRGLSDL